MPKHNPSIDLVTLAEISKDILEWQSTGFLPDDAALRRFASTIRNADQFGDSGLLRKAEDEAARAAMRFVVSHAEDIASQPQVGTVTDAEELSTEALALELRMSIALMAKTAKVRNDVWQRCASAALRAATILEELSPQETASEAPAEPATPKTSQEIVNEVNELAGLLLRQDGYEAPEGYLHYLSDNPRSLAAFQRAVEAYELITNTEAHDALQDVLPEDEDA